MLLKNCGGRTLFQAGTFFRVNKQCAACGFTIERANDEGFYLGSASLNFGMTIALYLVPVMLLAFYKVIGTTTAIVLSDREVDQPQTMRVAASITSVTSLTSGCTRVTCPSPKCARGSDEQR